MKAIQTLSALLPVLALSVLLALGGMLVPGAAFAKDEAPSFMKRLYPPELVMENHRAIELRKDQRISITKAIQATQASTVELRWSMQDAATRLTDEMNRPKVDRKAALAAAEEVMTLEGQVKRAHLGLLIEIKNTLDVDQQTKLDAIRARAD
jgi:hypothetical protein